LTISGVFKLRGFVVSLIIFIAFLSRFFGTRPGGQERRLRFFRKADTADQFQELDSFSSL